MLNRLILLAGLCNITTISFAHDHRKPTIVYDENGTFKGIVEYDARGKATYHDRSGTPQGYIIKPQDGTSTKGRIPYKPKQSMPAATPKRGMDRDNGITIYTDRHGTYQLREVPTNNGALFFDKSGRQVGQRIDDQKSGSSIYVDRNGTYQRREQWTGNNSKVYDRTGRNIGGYYRGNNPAGSPYRDSRGNWSPPRRYGGVGGIGSSIPPRWTGFGYDKPLPHN